MHYIDFLSRVAAAGTAKNYLEIGVNIGKSLRKVNLPSIGIDPKFIFRGDVMAAKPALHLYQITSDAYFETQNPKDHFPEGVDLAFLDGMHLFEFLLRDFINIERNMSDKGLIFFHDCLPINAEMTERDRRPNLRQDAEYKSHWTGDVWKIIPILKKYRNDLSITCIDCAPTGLVLVSNLSPTSSRLATAYNDILADWNNVELDDTGLTAFYNDLEIVPAARALEALES